VQRVGTADDSQPVLAEVAVLMANGLRAGVEFVEVSLRV